MIILLMRYYCRQHQHHIAALLHLPTTIGAHHYQYVFHILRPVLDCCVVIGSVAHTFQASPAL